jgi:hypothetical protein
LAYLSNVGRVSDQAYLYGIFFGVPGHMRRRIHVWSYEEEDIWVSDQAYLYGIFFGVPG